MRSTLPFAAALSLALVANAAAQAPTGTSAVGTQDPNWTVSWTATALGGGGNSGGAYSAYVVNPVAGVWQPNTLGGPGWISAWPTSSAANGVGDYNRSTNAGHRYTYSYSTSFLASAGTFLFTAGWDNIFESFTINGNTYAPSSLLTTPVVNGIPDHFGFCRDGDGVFLGSSYPNCSAAFAVGGLVNGLNTITLVLRGDGQTDGLIFSGESPAASQEVVPEPATMTLLATGLMGMAAARRRRKAPIA